MSTFNLQAEEENLDELFEELENEDLDNFRETRLEELKKEMDKLKNLEDSGHGKYVLLENEKDVMDLTTNENLTIVHFMLPDFKRCQIMDTHLEKLSKKYFRTKFAKVNVETAPFLVVKLGIKVLPFVIGFIKGQVIEKFIGFEKMGNNDNFKTEALENILLRSGLLIPLKLKLNNDSDEENDEEERYSRRTIKSSNNFKFADDEDY